MVYVIKRKEQIKLFYHVLLNLGLPDHRHMNFADAIVFVSYIKSVPIIVVSD